MKISTEIVSSAKLKTDVLVVFCCTKADYLKNKIKALSKEFPCAKAALKSGDFDAKKDNTLMIHLANNPLYKRLLCVGLGDKSPNQADCLRRASSTATVVINKAKLSSMAVRFTDSHVENPEANTAEVVEGIMLSCYSYDKFITKKKPLSVKSIALLVKDEKTAKSVRKAATVAQAVSEGVLLARDLANAPNNEINCQSIAQVAVESGKKAGFDVKVLEKAQIEKLKMAGLLAVNQGSERPPTFIIMEYKGAAKEDQPVVLVGKGLTFDTGGISLKGGGGMEEMKMDMHGGATVIGAMYAAAKAKLPINLVGLVPATENMPSGKALLPGDVLTYANGVTVEIISTDAEGRLILADGLIYAKRYNPQAVLDFATLTGSCMIALGDLASGLMGNNTELNQKILSAGCASAERLWELPMFDEYIKDLKSDVADTKNGGGRSAGAITAAKFLEMFVDDYPWAHIDIAGTGIRASQDSYLPKGGPGVGVRMLCNLLANWK